MNFTFEYDEFDISIDEMEGEHSIAQMPCASSIRVVKSSSRDIFTFDLPSQEQNQSVKGVSIRMSQPIKKPTNFAQERLSSLSTEHDSDLESAESSDSDDELLTPSEAKESQENYAWIMKKAYYLVREVKESKHRAPISSTILYDKLEQIMAENRPKAEKDDLFELASYSRDKTIKKSDEILRNKSKYAIQHRPSAGEDGLYKKDPACNTFSSILEYLTNLH